MITKLSAFFTAIHLALAPTTARALCSSSAGGFPARLTPDAASKIDFTEFRNLGLSPLGQFELPAGTALAIVGNPSCGVERHSFWVSALSEEEKLSRHRTIRFVLPAPREFAELQAELEADPCVSLVSPDLPVTLARVSDDPLFPRQAHMRALHFHQSWSDFFLPLLTRPKMTIAIIDTGVDLDHPDLEWNRWINPDEIPENGVDDDGNGYVDDLSGYNFAMRSPFSGPSDKWPDGHHGTHVAGLAAARFDNDRGGSGINGVAKIMSLNVFATNGLSASSMIENALRYAADKGADVINISLGTTDPSRSMQQALAYAVEHGSLVVVAAGNKGVELCESAWDGGFNSPASYGWMSGVVSVAATDAFDGQISFFSNYSAGLVKIAAPGSFLSTQRPIIGLLSTIPGGRYSELAGTSMASPIVAGAASLASAWLKAYGYESTPARLERILTESARIDPTLWGKVQGARSLDLEALADYLKSNYPPK